MAEGSFSEELRKYINVGWHWGWLLALVMILAGLSAYIISKQTTPVYRASTTILINEAPATKGTDYASVLASERLTQTYAQLLTTKPVVDGVIERLGLTMKPKKIQDAIDVQPIRDTQLIEVQVEDTDPVRAANIANALVTEFAEQTQELQASRYRSSKQTLETQLAQLDQQIQSVGAAITALKDAPENQEERTRLEESQAQYRQTYAYLLQSFEQVRLAEAQSTSSVVQAEPAVPPVTPVRPRVLFNTILAIGVGLLLAIGIVYLIEAWDDTLRSPDEIYKQLGLPILGIIGHHDIEADPLITVSQPRSPIAEAFRSLRTNIQFASVDFPINRLLVTSPSPSDGKTTVASNLAVVIAQSGRHVVLCEADLRRPRLHRIMRVSNRRGLSDLFVQSHTQLNGAIQKTDIQNLMTITSGSLPPNPSELLGSEKMADILSQIQEQASMIIVDTPPVLAVTDAAVLASRVDGVLLVVHPGYTKLDACKEAVEQMRRVGVNILGVVLNGVEFKRSRYYYYQYKGLYYSYYDQYNEEEPSKKR